MRHKLQLLVLLLEIFLMTAATVRATDLRGGVAGLDRDSQLPTPVSGVGVALFEVRPNGAFNLVRQTVTGPDGKYYFNDVRAGHYVLQIGGINYPLEVGATEMQDIPIIARVAKIPATPTSSATKENTYLGRVGNSEATFRLRFDSDGRVSGSYTQGGDTYRLEGRNPPGRLQLDEYTGDRLTAHLDLTQNSSEREVRWEGRMQNVYPNTNTYPVLFMRSR